MADPIPPEIDRPQNHAALAFLRGRSAHSDVSQQLSMAVRALQDVKIFCPDRAAYAYVVAYVGVRVFAFAIGMNSIYLRLDPRSRLDAIAAGAHNEPVPADGWVYFSLWSDAVGAPGYEKFVGLAYSRAKQAGGSAA